MNIKHILIAALAATLFANAADSVFEKVPDAARKALKGARGKPVRKGFVFINGHYLPPPYTVARYGTAIFINNVQATGQIVPWKTFLSTQAGGASAPASSPAMPARKVSAIDDLFDDGAFINVDCINVFALFVDDSGTQPMHMDDRHKRAGRHLRKGRQSQRKEHNSR